MLLVAFDHEIYRSANPDLVELSPGALEAHYEAHGRAEGRICSEVDTKLAFKRLLLDLENLLEIGPFNSPVALHPSTEYADLYSQDGLRRRAAEIGIPESGCPEIKWVLGEEGLSLINKRYSGVVSSHMIEHSPDLIEHLQQVANLLHPDGRYYLVVPDYRFCFDHYLPETTVADVLEAHIEKRVSHSMGSVIEHLRLTTHNDPVRHWNGDHGDDPRRKPVEISSFLGDDDSHTKADVHSWHFTPESFTTLISVLRSAELIQFEIERSYPTVRNNLEFFAVLKKPA